MTPEQAKDLEAAISEVLDLLPKTKKIQALLILNESIIPLERLARSGQAS
jgi:hypothetical protein